MALLIIALVMHRFILSQSQTNGWELSPSLLLLFNKRSSALIEEF